MGNRERGKWRDVEDEAVLLDAIDDRFDDDFGQSIEMRNHARAMSNVRARDDSTRASRGANSAKFANARGEKDRRRPRRDLCGTQVPRGTVRISGLRRTYSPAVLRMLTLARWLGPWANPARAPSGITRETVRIGDFDAFRYSPRRPRGAWLISPGLHHLGASDPRLDRFCRVLAATGCTVLSPNLPEPLRLRVSSRTPDDLRRALDVLGSAAIFSISFGSMAAIRVASDPRVTGLVVFGGYAELRDAIEFAMRGDGDPLNKPAVFLNAFPDAPVAEQWRAYCRETWGLAAMKDGGWRAVAERIAASVPEEHRDLCRAGFGLVERDVSLGDVSAFDPAPDAARVTCPTWIFHGADDDVIPVSHAPRLAAMFAHAKLHVTGLYGHSDRVRPKLLLKELTTMASMLHALASATTARGTTRTS